MTGLASPSLFDGPSLQLHLDAWMQESLDEMLQTTTQSTIPPIVSSCPDSLIEFVARHPFEVDHQPFTFDGRDYLRPIFDALTFKDRTQLSWVLMTGAQVAKSVTAMLALTHAAEDEMQQKRLFGQSRGELVSGTPAAVFIFSTIPHVGRSGTPPSKGGGGIHETFSNKKEPDAIT